MYTYTFFDLARTLYFAGAIVDYKAALNARVRLKV